MTIAGSTLSAPIAPRPFLFLRIAGAKISARYHWALKSGKELEKWAAGIRLLNEWFYLQSPDLHLEVSHRWMRYFPLLAKGAGIYHYRLGEPAA